MKILAHLFITSWIFHGFIGCQAQSGNDTVPAGSPSTGNSSNQPPSSSDVTVTIKEGDTFEHFVAHNKTRTCTSDAHARPFNNQIRGVNLGGWLVLEPWITPSLFYQFLGKDEKTTAFDIYSFCSVLGAKEANRQLRNHWDAWVTEDIINKLAQSNAVNSLRLPVGDFMYKPYGPYVGGCVDGALEYVDRLLDWAYASGMTVLIDVHTQRGSQNGFDNSGQQMGFMWTSVLNTYPAGLVTFQHWPIRTAEWMGTFDIINATYHDINHANIQHSLEVIQKIVDMYSDHPAVLGIEPVNEPWQYTPLEELKQFYWDGYLIVKKGAPYWKYVMHDSFRFDPSIWGGFMDGCPDRALDTHIYQAWKDPDSRINYYQDACGQKGVIARMEAAFGPIIVGEWSLATDNCAMWLNGFNDNLPGFPRTGCKYIPCGESYLGSDQPGIPVDPSKAIQGPYGTGMSGPVFGLCPVGRDWPKESSGNPLTGRDWVRAPPDVPPQLDDTDHVMTNLARKKINAFSNIGHGFYFWNFRTDLYEPHWSYLQALDRGWIPNYNLNDPKIQTACDKEDIGEFKCVVKKGQLYSTVHDAVAYALNFQNRSDTPEAQAILNLTGTSFMDAANDVLGEFFDKFHTNGATCDFGGIGMLIELNRTTPDDDALLLTDDEYFGYVVVQNGTKLWKIVLLVVIGTLVGSCSGFIVAMHTNKAFNRRVRESVIFRPIKNTKSNLLRSSLALPAISDFQDIDGDHGGNGETTWLKK